MNTRITQEYIETIVESYSRSGPLILKGDAKISRLPQIVRCEYCKRGAYDTRFVCEGCGAPLPVVEHPMLHLSYVDKFDEDLIVRFGDN